MRVTERPVRLLDEDPDLAIGIPESSLARAEHDLVVPSVRLEHGQERLLSTRSPEPDQIGLFVLEGLLLREIEVAGTACAELIGSGDLIHPGDVRGSDLTPLHGRLRWTILGEAKVAVLDRRFLARVGPWPQVMARIALRAVWRTHGLALSLAISHQGRVDDRLLLLFWHFAQRWGRVGRDGVRLELPLTHEVLGKLVGAQRPSVTTALGRLADRGVVRRPTHETWLLPLPIPDELEPLLSRTAAARNAEQAPARGLGAQPTGIED